MDGSQEGFQWGSFMSNLAAITDTVTHPRTKLNKLPKCEKEAKWKPEIESKGFR